MYEMEDFVNIIFPRVKCIPNVSRLPHNRDLGKQKWIFNRSFNGMCLPLTDVLKRPNISDVWNRVIEKRYKEKDG